MQLLFKQQVTQIKTFYNWPPPVLRYTRKKPQNQEQGTSLELSNESGFNREWAFYVFVHMKVKTSEHDQSVSESLKLSELH